MVRKLTFICTVLFWTSVCHGIDIEFFPSERTKSFGFGQGQSNYYLSDDLSAYTNPFPQEFIFSFPAKQSVSTFVLHNKPGEDAGSEINSFKLYYNNDIITPENILSIEDDGGGWCFKDVSGGNIVFQSLSPKNISGNTMRTAWVQSKDTEFNLNRENPKWVKIHLKNPTEISSIFIMSDDSANIDNLETDIFGLEIIVHPVSAGEDKSVYDNSNNEVVQDDYSKGFWKIFEPILVKAITIKFHSPKYVEWQRLLIFKSQWKEILSAEAKAKYYSPQIFTFDTTEPFQYLRLSVESNHGNKRWLSFGKIEAR